MKTIEIEAKSILTRSKLPDADFVINPYIGCRFGCSYCYASFMGRFVNESVQSWGDYVYVKVNAVALLERDLRRLGSEELESTILLSSVTDPYQGAESKYRLTRGLLTTLAATQFPGLVSLLTKSPLVTRDVDILQSLDSVEVGMTITTTDDRVSKWLEVRAPRASRRLEALAAVSASGVPTYAFVGPLLPHFVRRPDLLDDLFAAVAAAGVKEVYVEHINLKRYIRQRLREFLIDEDDETRELYDEARTDEHRQALDEVVMALLLKHGLKLRLGQVLYHDGSTPPPKSG